MESIMSEGMLHSRCTGCSACYSICPHEAIRMFADSDGFSYPLIDERLCVGCGLCRSVCPCFEKGDSASPLFVVAAKNKDYNVLCSSSSGGVFNVMASVVLARGGCVFGAAWRNAVEVSHVCVESKEDLPRLYGSKYLQSEIGNTFRHCRDLLYSGREVLFSGTPCQIHGLNRFIAASGGYAKNLYSLQVICHAIPSPLAWARYLQSLERRYCVKVDNVNFRDKILGWRSSSLSVNDRNLVEDWYSTLYARAYFNHLITRKSCECCPSRNFRSGADLTIGDFWGIEEVMDGFDSDMGVSVVIAGTRKGKLLLKAALPHLEWRESDMQSVLLHNPSIIQDIKPNPMRERFLKEALNNDFWRVAERSLKPAFYVRIRERLASVARKLGLQ